MERLANDKRELASFLADSNAWISGNDARLSTPERKELESVASDSLLYLERECRSEFGDVSEARFCRGRDIERRRFVIAAASAALAGFFAAGPAKASRGGSRSDESGLDLLVCDEDPAGCWDPACGDTSPCVDSDVCNDDDICYDTGCTNVNVCKDSESCVDSDCVNSTVCGDLRNCSDNPSCQNGAECNDVLCYDNSCENLGECNDVRNCIDDGCINAFECFDEAECIDTGGCTNSGSCGSGAGTDAGHAADLDLDRGGRAAGRQGVDPGR